MGGSEPPPQGRMLSRTGFTPILTLPSPIEGKGTGGVDTDVRGGWIPWGRAPTRDAPTGEAWGVGRGMMGVGVGSSHPHPNLAFTHRGEGNGGVDTDVRGGWIPWGRAPTRDAPTGEAWGVGRGMMGVGVGSSHPHPNLAFTHRGEGNGGVDTDVRGGWIPWGRAPTRDAPTGEAWGVGRGMMRVGVGSSHPHPNLPPSRGKGFVGEGSPHTRGQGEGG